MGQDIFWLFVWIGLGVGGTGVTWLLTAIACFFTMEKFTSIWSLWFVPVGWLLAITWGLFCVCQVVLQFIAAVTAVGSALP